MEERILPDWMQAMSSKNQEVKKDQTKVVPESKPVLKFSGKVRYTSDFADCAYICDAILERLAELPELIVGLDIEWPYTHFRPGKKGQPKTALIQLCPTLRVCYLFHVWTWHRLPKVFFDLLSHTKVRLVGLNIRSDIWKLGRDFGLQVGPIVERNAIELSSLANQVFNIRTRWSLDRLTLYVVKQQLDKSPSVRLSDWSCDSLTPEQMRYAATDSYVSLLVYNRLKEIQVELKDAANDECVEPGQNEVRGGAAGADENS